jgi:hypothetical protein
LYVNSIRKEGRVNQTPTDEDLSAQLEAARDALRKAERIAAVAHDAADGMHEAGNSLEVITNLHYLIRHSCRDPEQVLAYLEQAETASLRLLQINHRILQAHREAMADADGVSGHFVM